MVKPVDQSFPFDLSLFEMMMHQPWKECANEKLKEKNSIKKLQDFF